MTTIILDASTENLVGNLARKSGMTVEQTAGLALAEGLKQLAARGRADDAAMVPDVMAIARRLAAQIRPDSPSLEELMYDRDGLPI